MNKCDNCICNPVCDHNIFGFENCGNYKGKSSLVIDTKYNIGDIVYIADCFYGEYIACKIPYIIKAVHISIEEDQQEIKYVLVNNRLGYTLLKQDSCFPTYAECTKWCEEYNKISYTLPS